MLNIRASKADKPNPKFAERKRARGDNIAWIKPDLPGDGKTAGVLLIGGKSPVDFRVRVAQSHARQDLTPSHWSHVALPGKTANAPAETPLFEIALQPPDGFGYPPVTNGVQRGTLERYRDPTAYPNIAVMRVPVEWRQVEASLERFTSQRAVLDALELLMLWLAFAWGVGRAGNPLLEGQGLPSATMIEFVIGAAGFELTPGLASRSSCPEAMWQAARWWHEYYG